MNEFDFLHLEYPFGMRGLKSDDFADVFQRMIVFVRRKKEQEMNTKHIPPGTKARLNLLEADVMKLERHSREHKCRIDYWREQSHFLERQLEGLIEYLGVEMVHYPEKNVFEKKEKQKEKQK